jgi:hypothetical protein
MSMDYLDNSRKLLEAPERLFTNMTLPALQSLLQSLDQTRIREV